MVKLGEVATYINGYAFKPSDWSNEGLPIIRIQDLTGTSYQANKYNGKYDSKYEINNGDVLISWSASLGVYSWNKGKALLNQHIFKVVFDKVSVNKDFFVFQVESLLKKAQTEAHGATMKHLTKSTFNSLPFYLPSIAEQEIISDKLNKVSFLIKVKEQQLIKYDEFVKSRFIEMFGDPVSNSKNIMQLTLPELGKFGRGVSKHRPRNAIELLGGEYPLIQTGDVAKADLYITEYSETYSELGLKQSKMWNSGTLCITIAANIAKTAILNFDACFPDSVVGFNANSLTNNIYIHYWFSFFQKILEKQAPESAQKNINLKVLSELKVIVPPIELQNKFIECIKSIDKSKFECSIYLNLLKTFNFYKDF